MSESGKCSDFEKFQTFIVLQVMLW